MNVPMLSERCAKQSAFRELSRWSPQVSLSLGASMAGFEGLVDAGGSAGADCARELAAPNPTAAKATMTSRWFILRESPDEHLLIQNEHMLILEDRSGFGKIFLAPNFM